MDPDNLNNRNSSSDNQRVSINKQNNNNKKSLSREVQTDFTELVTNYVLNRQSNRLKNLQSNHNNNNTESRQSIGGSILKNSTKVFRTSANNGTIKPNTILSMEDRDIVIIDKADYNESVKNQDQIIIVEKTSDNHQQDLAQILGTNWPAAAGSAAQVLNTEYNPKSNSKSSSSSSAVNTMNSSTSPTNNTSNNVFYSKTERNKSMNVFSHLNSTKVEKKYRDSNNYNTTLTDNYSGFNNNSPRKGIGNINYSNVSTESNIIPFDDRVKPRKLTEISGTNFGIGSMVEVITNVTENLHGVIVWIGKFPDVKYELVGVELEEEIRDTPLDLTDGTYNGIRLFQCPPGRAIFVDSINIISDHRFEDQPPQQKDIKLFGKIECQPIEGQLPPIKILKLNDLEKICGKGKGIQGHHNSCYLDATLFAMFSFTSVFDSLLFRPPGPDDNRNYKEVQKVLREEIVNPMRKNVFVRADRVMKLRELLEKLTSVTGLTTEEKDPEEFLNSLLVQILKAEPFLKLSSGQDTFYYQLFVEKDERLSFPTVQQLFEQSFLSSDIKLKEVPSCLIIQMPRFGTKFKMYPRILPSSVLDITDIIENSPRQCSVCGKLAEYECKDCYDHVSGSVGGLENTAFCMECLKKIHSHDKRQNHKYREILVPQDFKKNPQHVQVQRLFMELFAVVCIETSHYVAFVKAGPGLEAPWCFFDSMADRKGELHGYNIPEIISVPDLPQWLSDEGSKMLHEKATHDKLLPETAKRLLCDAYMCMYQSTDVMMYR